MPALSYKEFMEEVRSRLKNFSAEELRELILEWASEEHPSKRHEFLGKLITPGEKQETGEDTLVEEIEAFAQRVEGGEYCEGWGWDDEIYDERDFGDESWAEEMDEFFLRARNLMLQEDCSIAEEAYRKLFDVLEMAEEPGHLPGDEPTTMLTVEINEQLALFLRAIYMNSFFQRRAPLLFEAMHKYRYLDRQINLKSVMDALDGELPDFEDFLDEWILFLKDQNRHLAYGDFSFSTSALLRGAVFLKGGVPAISEFARQNAGRYPRAYLDWVKALEAQADRQAMIQVAREGLGRIPKNYRVRAELAETIAKIGEELNDNELKLEGYRESFYSSPSMRCLLDLYLTAVLCDCLEEIREEAEQRMAELCSSKGAPGYNYLNDGELDTSSASEGLLYNALLLGGKHEKVLAKCKGKGPLGWSSRDNPKPVFVAFLMVALSKELVYSEALFRQWEEAIRNTSFGADENYVKKYQQMAGLVKEALQLTDEQEAFYLKWCKDVVGRRVDAIVSNKYRKSYHKAAGLLVAMAETLANRGEKEKGVELVEKYRGKYPRHSAFKSEIVRALELSGL